MRNLRFFLTKTPNPITQFPFYHFSTTPNPKIFSIVDEIASLSLLEAADLTELLKHKLGVDQMPIVSLMMPGMGIGFTGFKGTGQNVVAGEKKGGEVLVEEKTAWDLTLEGGYEAGAKIRIIKEVRSVTELGLKEAKELVEKAPVVLKKGVAKEEAERIVEKMKAVGAKVVLE
ncbi:hypothetical protein Droror1_Dr00009187 [Drosera rotundifolia]